MKTIRLSEGADYELKVVARDGKWHRMKNWLARNKIVFETLVAASLTIMGILVSIAAANINQKANELSDEANKLLDRQNELIKQQYELDLYGKEPVFSVNPIEEDGVPYYIITKIGTEIYNVRYTVRDIYPYVFYAGTEHQEQVTAVSYTVRHISNGSNYNTDDNEETDSWKIPVYRHFQGDTDEPYDIIVDIANASWNGPIWVSWTEIELDYYNHRNERCSKKLVMEYYEGGAGRDWKKPRHCYTLNSEDEIMFWEKEDDLVVDVYGTTSTQKIQSKIYEYCAEHNLIPYLDYRLGGSP